MKRTAGAIVLGLSACGYPLTQLAVRRGGVPGALVAECACAGLAIRDASMVASGVPGRLRPIPAVLLYLELAAGGVASLAGLGPLLNGRPAARAALARIPAAETVRRGAATALFTLHTIRFYIYLRPAQGRRKPAGPDRPAPGEGRDGPGRPGAGRGDRITRRRAVSR